MAGRVARFVAVTFQQQLQGDTSVEVRVVGGVDHPHAAGAEQLEGDVAVDRASTLELMDLRALLALPRSLRVGLQGRLVDRRSAIVGLEFRPQTALPVPNGA